MLVVTEAARRRTRRRSRRRPRQWLRRGQWQWPQLPQSVVIRGRARLVEVCGLVSLYLTEQATEAEAAWVASAVSAQRTEEKESQNVLRGLHKAFSWEAEGRETVTTRYINPKSIDLE